MNQHEKIIELCSENEWVCGNDFRKNYVFSFHKRMIEIEGRKNKNQTPTGKYIFGWRKCTHGYAGVRDYQMTENKLYQEPPKEIRRVARLDENGVPRLFYLTNLS